ncbi:hypothetical protein Cantr_06252 [Candida viswanathii]|uniref:Zn(2)-C6 fungal-type domain-containing protein n=1 Tax=Candida viswanathii TaxID=5486 RepID=A0A367XVU9_9ASCO|nr:hypothetical protein Cantr_06252 [Candida viswanathii]
MTRQTSKRVVRCLSCRKLKIRCDEGKPSCEYCRHRGKVCVYPEKEETPAPKQDSLCIIPQNVFYGEFVTSMSQVDFDILNLFIEKYELVLAFGSKVLIATWQEEVRDLVHQNQLLRKSYLTMGSQIILHFEDDEILGEISMVTDFPVDDLKSTALVSLYGKNKLLLKTINYFNESLHELMECIAKVQQGELTETMAREVFASGMILYGYMVYAYPLLPLVSFDNQVVDYLTLAVKFDIVEKICATTLAKSSFYKFFMYPDDEEYLRIASPPVITELQTHLDLLRREETLSGEELEICTQTLQVFKLGIHRALHLGSPHPIFNALISFGSDFCCLVHEGNEFATRLLFVYSTVVVFCKYYIKRDRNIWIDYINWFKESEIGKYGKFRHQADEHLYYLATQTKFVTRCGELRHFDPALYVLMYKELA